MSQQDRQPRIFPDEMKDFFISYNQADRGWAEWIAWQLEEAGYATVLQAWDFTAGTNFVQQMDRATHEAKRTIAVLSPDYLSSQFAKSEWQAAFAQDPTGEQGKLLPVRVRECELAGLLAQIRYIDLMDLSEVEAQERLLAEIKQDRLKPSRPPGFPGPTERTISRRAGFPGLSPEALARYEQEYRERLKARFAEDAPYFVPLKGETTEVEAEAEVEAQAPRSARRRRQRALAEYQEWIQAGQEIKRVKLNTLREGVDKYDCIILLGEPGSGKTTALEHLAYKLADEELLPPSGGKVGKGGYLPLPLRLSEFGPGMSVEELIIRSWAGTEQAGHWGMPELAANLERYLEAGQLFILFDALNEMPHEGYQKRAQALRGFIDHWKAKGNRFLVTCRVLDYGEELAGLQRVEIQPLNDEQIRILLQKELPDEWPTLWQALSQAGEFQSKIENRQSLIDLARNPYLLTMMVDIFVEDGQLGQNRAELMERFTQILMGWAKAKCEPQDWLEAEVQREALSVMAFEMQERAGSGTVVETGKIKTVMPEMVQPDPLWPPRPAPAEQVLRLAASVQIIEMPVDRSSVRFYHQLLQEYFAARELLKRVQRDPQGFQNPAGLAGKLWQWPWLEEEMPSVGKRSWLEPLPPPPPSGWEETTVLAAGLEIENPDQLVLTLARINPVLAGRCLHEGVAKVDTVTRQSVIAALLETITRPEVALRVRNVAGEVLGYLGDPRLGEMVTVPAGKFLMGEGDQQHELSLPDFQIGKYPVTNAEYAQFITAGGYQEIAWWTESGWQKKEKENWTEPGWWQDSRFNKPNQPVVGISWFECMAYCQWLSVQMDQQYCLPTEAAWEKAARGSDGRLYPWGNQFKAAYLNAAEGFQAAKTTTPVGIYPGGVSPFGVFDCAGNVWEWCTTRAGNIWLNPGYQFKPYPYDVAQEEWVATYLEGESVRALRGGSWGDRGSFARCPNRGGGEPGERRYAWGFRVVAYRALG